MKPDRHKRAKPDDPEQSKRFIETARAIGAGETEESAGRALKKVDLRKQGKPQSPKKKVL